MSKEVREFLKETVSVIIIAFILAMILRNYVIEGREIPTGSMLPTVKPVYLPF
jgi:signal peptidase I